jgi:hypothetical protein
MSPLTPQGLYLGSWEYLYLAGTRPRGLPNQIFSHHPWALIVFENIYCDKYGLEGERAAFDALQWTNSKLFIDLAHPVRAVIQPIDGEAILRTSVESTRRSEGFESEHRFQTALTQASDEDLSKWKIRLITPLLRERKLHLYDWPSAQEGAPLPFPLVEAVEQADRIAIGEVEFAKRISELHPSRV